MKLKLEELIASGIKFSIEKSGVEIARARLYILSNDLHTEPFGFIEDVFVEESFRGQGLGSQIVKEVISKAMEKGCYKIICTSQYGKVKVHDLYGRIGFQDYGKEFRIYF